MVVVDFQRTRPHSQPVSIEGVNVEVVSACKCLGLQLDDKLHWLANTDIVHRNG